MKHKHLAISSAAALFLTGMLAAPALAQSIPDGTYMATFGQTECGILTVTSSSLGYKYGQCSSGKITNVTYTASSVSRRGDTVRIDQARFKIDKIEGNRLIGEWTLGTFKNRKIFMKQ